MEKTKDQKRDLKTDGINKRLNLNIKGKTFRDILIDLIDSKSNGNTMLPTIQNSGAFPLRNPSVFIEANSKIHHLKQNSKY